MSRTPHNPRYNPVSYDQSQQFPMWEVESEAQKQQYSTRAVDLRPFPAASLLSQGGPRPTYHAVDNRSPSWISRVIRDSWTLEILAWLVALGSMVVMLCFLKRYDQRPQSEWPFAITVNAFLQVFTTTLRGAILMPVAQSISQLKWVWFLRNDRALEDFAIFDSASRGIWGSLCLIWHQKAARLASLGALITIMTLATSTFVQQAVSFPDRPTVTGNGIAVATLNTHYTDIAGIFDVTGQAGAPIAAMKGAFYNGLLREYRDKVQPAAPICSTGNCTWPLYSSLAICSSVSNITPNLEASGNGGNEELTLSNGDQLVQQTDDASLNITDDLRAVASSGSGSFDRSSIAFGAVQNPLADFSIISKGPDSAVECLLELCVHTFNTSVANGVANTTVVTRQTAASLGITWLLPNDSSMKPWQRNPSPMINLTVPSSAGGVNYSTAVDAMLALQIWIGKAVPGYSSRWNIASSDSVDTIKSAMVGDFVANTGLLMDNIATAMTNNIRISTGCTNVTGTAYENVVYIHVEWKWLIFPIALLVLSFVSLTATIIKTQFSSVGIWKDSTLATMQVLSEETRRELGPLSTNARMTKIAEGRDVRLRNVGSGWEF